MGIRRVNGCQDLIADRALDLGRTLPDALASGFGMTLSVEGGLTKVARCHRGRAGTGVDDLLHSEKQ